MFLPLAAAVCLTIAIGAMLGASTVAAKKYADWQYLTPRPARDALNGVWVAESNEVYAVGENGLILHFDGAEWRRMESGTVENLNCVHGDADEVYAAGRNGTVLRFDGNQWSPVADAPENHYQDVWGPDAAGYFWFAGSATSFPPSGPARYKPSTGWKALDWGGSTPNVLCVWGEDNRVFLGGGITFSSAEVWEADTSGVLTGPATLGGTRNIERLSGTNTSNIWASNGGASIFEFDGTTWSLNHVSSRAVRDLHAFDNDDVMFINDQERVVRYDGSTWTQDADLNAGEPSLNAWALAGLTANNAYAVGEIVSSGSGWKASYIGRRDDTDWKRTGSDDPPVPFTISEIWADAPDNLVAVGWRYDAGANAYVHDGQAWSPMPGANDEQLRDIWGKNGEFAAVGTNGAVREFTGGVWQDLPRTTNNTFMSIWGTSLDDLYRVNAGSALTHWDGISWSTIPNTEPWTFAAVTGAGARIFVAATAIFGFVGLEVVGGQLQEMPGGPLQGGADNLYALGDQSIYAIASGNLHHFDGVSWSKTGDLAHIKHSLWGYWDSDHGTDRVFVVGNGGLAGTRGSIVTVTDQGSSETLISDGTIKAVHGVYGPLSNDCVAVHIYAAGGDFVLVSVDSLKTTPVLVRSFDGTATEQGRVELSWELVADKTIDRIEINRGGLGAAMSRIGVAEAERTRFVDPHVAAGEKYDYQLRIFEGDGGVVLSPRVTVTLPKVATSLGQNEPNPFNPSTRIAFSLDADGPVRLDVYDVRRSSRHPPGRRAAECRATRGHVEWHRCARCQRQLRCLLLPADRPRRDDVEAHAPAQVAPK